MVNYLELGRVWKTLLKRQHMLLSLQALVRSEYVKITEGMELPSYGVIWHQYNSTLTIRKHPAFISMWGYSNFQKKYLLTFLKCRS